MEWAGVVTLLLVICVSCHLLISFKRKRLQTGKLPPGPTPLPLIGNFLQIKSGETLKFLLKLHKKYGPVFTVYFGSRPVLVLCGHRAVKEALIDKAEEFSGRCIKPTVERAVEGYGLAFSNGERWKQLRRFSSTALKSFGMGKKSIEERIQEEVQILLEEFRKMKGKPIEPTDFLGCAVSNIICSIVFGERFDYEDEEFQALLRIIYNFFWEISTTWSQLYDMFPTFLKYFPGPHTRVYDIVSDALRFIDKRVKKNQETLDSNFPRDFIDCFLIQMEKEKDNPLSEFNFKNLEHTIFALFFAGTEAVSSTLKYGFLLLMKYPKVQAKMHEEIDRVIGHDRIPNSEDRRQMPYTDAVIHEVQRVCDLVPMSSPHMVTCDTEFRGYFIPKGMEVFPVLSTVLHDTMMFKSPNGFNPENFLDENGCFKKNDAFVPYSAGKRSCPGESLARMELFLFCTTILQSFQLKPLVPPEDLDPTPLENGFMNVPPFYHLSFIPR